MSISTNGNLTLTGAILPPNAWGVSAYSAKNMGESQNDDEGGGGWTDARAGGILPLHPLFVYYIAS